MLDNKGYRGHAKMMWLKWLLLPPMGYHVADLSIFQAECVGRFGQKCVIKITFQERKC